jgi:nucleoside-diphosphate kinase
MMEKTLAIIKPDGIQKRIIGEIVKRFEACGLRVVAAKMLHLSKAQASGFYAVHREMPFFSGLIEFICSGPVLVMVLEGEGAILKNREVMGATDPAKALPGTIRRDYGTDVEQNTVHGSDSPETARWEIGYFFGEMEIF